MIFSFNHLKNDFPSLKIEEYNLKDLPDCKGCAKCCKNLDVPIIEGMDKIPAELTYSIMGFPYMKRLENGSCIALDEKTNLCTIYENRPKTCRDFDRGNPRCRILFKELKI